MQPGVHAGFEQIVLGGLLVPRGMPKWDDRLTPDQVRAIHAYLIDLQGKLRTRELELQRRGLPLDTQALTILTSY